MSGCSGKKDAIGKERADEERKRRYCGKECKNEEHKDLKKSQLFSTFSPLA